MRASRDLDKSKKIKEIVNPGQGVRSDPLALASLAMIVIVSVCPVSGSQGSRLSRLAARLALRARPLSAAAPQGEDVLYAPARRLARGGGGFPAPSTVCTQLGGKPGRLCAPGAPRPLHMVVQKRHGARRQLGVAFRKAAF